MVNMVNKEQLRFKTVLTILKANGLTEMLMLIIANSRAPSKAVICIYLLLHCIFILLKTSKNF